MPPLTRSLLSSADADEVEEIELGDRSPDGELRMPAAARLPVERQARLEEFERAVGAACRRAPSGCDISKLSPASTRNAGETCLPALT